MNKTRTALLIPMDLFRNNVRRVTEHRLADPLSMSMISFLLISSGRMTAVPEVAWRYSMKETTNGSIMAPWVSTEQTYTCVTGRMVREPIEVTLMEGTVDKTTCEWPRTITRRKSRILQIGLKRGGADAKFLLSSLAEGVETNLLLEPSKALDPHNTAYDATVEHGMVGNNPGLGITYSDEGIRKTAENVRKSIIATARDLFGGEVIAFPGQSGRKNGAQAPASGRECEILDFSSAKRLH